MAGGKALLYPVPARSAGARSAQPAVEKLLSECGYAGAASNACLARLISRLRTEKDFPHEVGLFLGYPPADVDGFMHRKESYKLCGLWKVYDDVEGAVRQFARCRRCTEVYLTACSAGFTLDRLAVPDNTLFMVPKGLE